MHHDRKAIPSKQRDASPAVGSACEPKIWECFCVRRLLLVFTYTSKSATVITAQALLLTENLFSLMITDGYANLSSYFSSSQYILNIHS